MTVADWLRSKGAVHDVVTWAARYGDDWQRALSECPRGDWLLGIAVKLGADPKRVVSAACACAREASSIADDERTTRAIEAAERWARGEGAIDDATLTAAERAVDEADDPAVAAARTAGLAAARAVREPGDAAFAAAATAQALLLATGECAQLTAASYAMHKCAEHVRAIVNPEAP